MTRHNTGFYCLDKLAQKYNIEINKGKFKATIGQGKIKGKDVILLKPQTFMNLSGEAVRAIKDFYKLDTKDILIIYDDIDLPFGTIRYRKSGSAGTHNGMRNIVENMKSTDISRVRVGIAGQKYEKQKLYDYVLGKFSNDEQKQLEEVSTEVINKVEEVIGELNE